MRHSDQQRGQILVLSAIVMAFLFVPLAVFVIDTTLVESGYAQLSETLEASAENGAQMVDQGQLRSSGGQTVVLNPIAAKALADRSMSRSALPGLSSWRVAADARSVTVTATLTVNLMVLPPAHITESGTATFAYGQ
jgi:hypothetical protein